MRVSLWRFSVKFSKKFPECNILCFFNFLHYPSISVETPVPRSWYCIRRGIRCFWTHFQQYFVMKMIFGISQVEEIKIIWQNYAKICWNIYVICKRIFVEHFWFIDTERQQKLVLWQNIARNVFRNIKFSLKNSIMTLRQVLECILMYNTK